MNFLKSLILILSLIHCLSGNNKRNIEQKTKQKNGNKF
jgi:hypothetical protein